MINILVLDEEEKEDSELTKIIATLLKGRKLQVRLDPELSSQIGAKMMGHFNHPVGEIIISTSGSGIISEYEDEKGKIEYGTPGHKIVIPSGK